MKLLKSVILTFMVIKSLTTICQNENKEFGKEFFVKGQEIFTDDYNVEYINVIDTFLLAKLRSGDYIFSLYNIKTGKKITEIAFRGNGPNEFPISLSFTGQYEKENGSIYFWARALSTNKLYKINITESIKQNRTIINDEYKYSPICFFDNVFFIDSANLIGRTSNLSPHINRLLIYNPTNDKIVKTVEPFPKVKNTYSDNLNFIFYRYNSLYNSSLGLKPDRSKIVSAMNMFNRIDIFDISGNLLNSYIDKNTLSDDLIKEYLSAKQNNVDKVNIKLYYQGIYASNSFIYVVYQNRLYYDYNQSIPVYIRIFNWNADPICEIKVPDYLQYISIDEKNEMMYGSAVIDEKIFKYDISSILDEIKTGSK
jgi:hypothetical protein